MGHNVDGGFLQRIPCGTSNCHCHGEVTPSVFGIEEIGKA